MTAETAPSFQGPVRHQWETWETISQKTTALANDIARRTLLSVNDPNYIRPITKIAVVPRGGLYIVNILARELSLDGSEVVSLGISKYKRDDPMNAGKFKIAQLPSRDDVEGETVLIADEVHDTGETTDLAKKILLDLGAAAVLTAAVHTKPSKRFPGLEGPDVYIEETDAWVHYPWEVIDDKGTVYARALQAHLTANAGI